MQRLALWCWFASVLLLALSAGTRPSPAAEDDAPPDAQGVEFFEKHIRPVLTQQCYKCHSQGATKIKGNLLLDTREGSRVGGENGPAVVPGSVDESLLISALRHEDFEMPPGNKLADDVVAKFEQWIEMGAPDPRDGKPVIFGRREIDLDEGRKFWAFQLPRRTPPPQVKSAAWPRGDIDRYVLAGIEAHQLSPAADAQPRELVRRLYFDIIGLPPSPSAIDNWSARLAKGNEIDQAALAEMVDELLASPQFGQRWGRHWLDVARYADSNGSVDNTPFPHAWRYRNWVIDALNADMPYDQFITEQLAGDLLPYETPQQRNDHLVATGFLAIGSKPRAQNNPNFAMDVVAEQIEVTTSAMLGLTVACARCHDHKYDPIPTDDFYAMAGIFISSRAYYGDGGGKGSDQRLNPGGLITLMAVGDQAADEAEKLRGVQQQLTSRKQEITAELKRMGVEIAAGDKGNKQQQKQQQKAARQQLAKLEKRLERVTAAGDAKKIERVKAEIARWQRAAGEDSQTGKDSAAVDKKQVKTFREELAQIEGEITAIDARLGGGGQAMGVLEGQPADCAICIAGESADRGPKVPRGFVRVATSDAPPAIESGQSGRLQLAQWVASQNHPLTARVMVNRIWQHLMGRGIVKSVDNFGELGERPTHPELLDHLALQFVEEHWSVKRMIRAIALTRTYQMSSAHHEKNYDIDPDNVWLWRISPQRLDAESFRDAILAFSGKLDLNRPDGPPALQVANRKEAPKTPDGSSRRSVYLPIVRNGEPEALLLFDFADPNIVVGEREETTVPSQSLYLLNSPFVAQHARAAAERLLAETARMSNGERVDLAYLSAFGRRPTDEQRGRALAYIASAAGETDETSGKNEAERATAWATFCHSLIAAAEFRYLD